MGIIGTKIKVTGRQELQKEYMMVRSRQEQQSNSCYSRIHAKMKTTNERIISIKIKRKCVKHNLRVIYGSNAHAQLEGKNEMFQALQKRNSVRNDNNCKWETKVEKWEIITEI